MSRQLFSASTLIIVLVFLFLGYGQNGTATAGPEHAGTAALTSSSAATVTWATMSPMHTPRSGLGLAATADGKLYAIGGG